MDLKKQFRPTKEKIIYALLLLAVSLAINISAVLVDRGYISLSDFYKHVGSLEGQILYPSETIVFVLSRLDMFGLHTIAILLTFFLVAYVFGCFTSGDRRWFERAGIVVLYLVTFMIISYLMYSLLVVYNETDGRSCNVDSDCSYDCQYGSYNKYVYMRLINPEQYNYLCLVYAPVCINGRCSTIYYKEAKIPEDCERFANDFEKSACYGVVAEKLDSPELCEKIKYSKSMEDTCYNNLAIRLRNITLCYKIDDESDRMHCIGALQ